MYTKGIPLDVQENPGAGKGPAGDFVQFTCAIDPEMFSIQAKYKQMIAWLQLLFILV